MKKFLTIFTLAVILTLLAASAALADPGGNPRGVVTEIDEAAGTLTLELSDGTTLFVTVPSGIPSDIQVGMTVMVKGNQTSEGFVADWVRQVGAGDEEEAEGSDSESNGNAWGETGVFCNGGKDEPHPVAAKIAEEYGVGADWVMEYACDGHGFGGVMLALQSQQASGGEPGKAEKFLDQRKEGKGWGQIWKDSGLVGNPSAGSPPPGLLKNQDKDVGPPEGKGWNNDTSPNPNSNGQGPNKNSDQDSTGEEDAETD